MSHDLSLGVAADISASASSPLLILGLDCKRHSATVKLVLIAIADVMGVLTDSVHYVRHLRRRDSERAKGWGQIANPLSVKQRLNAEGSQPVKFCHGLRLQMLDQLRQHRGPVSAEPFKRWLAQVG